MPNQLTIKTYRVWLRLAENEAFRHLYVEAYGPRDAVEMALVNAEAKGLKLDGTQPVERVEAAYA